jgi:hypothetical protein
MGFFRRTHRRTLLLWSLLLSLSLLCGQGIKLHVHNLDHDESIVHTHAASDHSRLSRAHYARDTSHSEHHDVVVSDVDVTPDGVWKKLSSNTLTLALLTLLFMLVLSVPSRQWVHRYRESKSILFRRYLLSPPLRAPPHKSV